MKKEIMGYASKNLNKTVNRHVWTPVGVIPVGVHTNPADADRSFRVTHIKGHNVSLPCNDVGVAVETYIEGQAALAKEKHGPAMKFISRITGSR